MSDQAPSYADPLSLRLPVHGEEAPDTYWHATAGPVPRDDGVLKQDMICEVAVIGGGYTGLASAYYLARLGIGPVAVLEANRPGWGCSGRNGSFARPAIGRIPYEEWDRRWGRDIADAMFSEALAALQTVRDTIAEAAIDCEVMPEGWLKVAHRPGQVSALQTEGALLRERFGLDVDFLDGERLAAEHVRGGEAYAALRWPVSFAMHPVKLAYGLVNAAREAGASIHGGTPVIGLDKEGAYHRLSTPAAEVRARHVVIATNGYSVEKLFAPLRSRLLPVLSNVVVTQPLTAEEKAEGNFRTTDCISDTRKMLYYYRRLPDDRIMLGGKGPVRPGPEAMARHREALLAAIGRKFPFMQRPRADYFWGGWVALTRDSIPHVATAEDDKSLHYAMGYIGSGVSCSIHAGRRLAEHIAGRGQAFPPPMARGLPKYPFAAFRRLGQAVAMSWFAHKDEKGL